MADVKHTPTAGEKEMARTLFVAGYHQALDDVAKALSVPADAGFLAKLRAKAAGVVARAAIARATGAARATEGGA